MTFLDWVAAVVLFLQLPIPLYWFVVHPQVRFWRRHQGAAYTTGLLVAWGTVTAFLFAFHDLLFSRVSPPAWATVAGLALLVLDGFIFSRVKRDLGGSRLVGKTELSGGGEIATTGIYAHVRHPRYAGSMAAVAGASFLAGTWWTWLVAGIWCALVFLAILLEERELRTRFGDAYAEYCRRVPRFLPLRFRPREGQVVSGASSDPRNS